ncbi:Hypothetical protein A7982_01596 [Minicystis rosea]|nr:Hypothetical protein A7982_01596 [Minicystis rosea]
MPYDPTRLASYVRFYLTVVKQLGAAWENLDRTHGVVKEVLQPFGEPLARVGSAPLAAALGAPPSFRESFAELFRPENEESLSGLVDLYEVAGRFSFQGEENANLARVQALVSGARNEIVAQRMRLADLIKLPDVARAVASRLASEEATRAGTARAEKTAAFEPLAEQVHLRAKQTMEAVKAVPMPDLATAESAADDYKRYITKLEQFYQTCLPFLRKAIASLYSFVGAEPTASWPDTLPLARELPAELVTLPPADSPELSQARAALAAIAEEEIALGRAQGEIATSLARYEGELAAAAVHDKEIEVEIAKANHIADYLAATEAAQNARQTLASLEQQKADRVRAAGEVWQRHQSIEAGIKVLEEELKARVDQMAQGDAELAAEKKAEPVLFGKDEWRMRVAAIEGQLESQRAAYQQRQGVLNGLRIDLSSVSVQVQTEQQQALLVDRQLADTRATLEAIQKSVRDLASTLGTDRPARPVPVSEAREALAGLQQARIENGQRIDRLKAEMRRQKEETVRVLSRLKQIGVERQQLGAMVQSAEVAVSKGREEALRHLASQRRAAVERHVSEVLGTLEKSLTMVGPVFVDPARKVMTDATEPKPEVALTVIEAADKVAPVVEKLGRELDAELLAQDAALGQIQREFCDVAVSACKAAWS